MELFMILTITLGGLLYVGYPLFTDVGRWRSAPRRTRSREEELRARKRHALAAIKELEFDHQMGKLSDEDYRSLRSRYEKEAMDTMRGLDGLGKGGRFRTKKGEEGRLICSSCGDEVPSRSRFCPNCGTRFDGAEQPS